MMIGPAPRLRQCTARGWLAKGARFAGSHRPQARGEGIL